MQSSVASPAKRGLLKEFQLLSTENRNYFKIKDIFLVKLFKEARTSTLEA